MAKKKWYVVTVGRSVGVFPTWLEVAALISGVPGALHQSFPTEEEATRVFEAEREKGNTRIVGSDRARSSSQGCCQASPTFNSTITVPRMNNAARTPLTLSRARKQRAPPFSLQKSPAHTGTPTRSRSPALMHDNVSYNRGNSSAPTSSRDLPGESRPVATPRVVVRTPSDIASYPSDSESNLSSISSSSRINQTRPIGSLRHVGVPRTSLTPSTSSAKSSRRTSGSPVRALLQTPSGLVSYPSVHISTFTSVSPSPRVNQADPLLSPLNSPGLYTTGSPVQRSGKRSHSSDPRRRGANTYLNNPANSPSPGVTHHSYQEVPTEPLVYTAPHPNDHSQCQHTCPHCRHPFTYVTDCVVPFSLSQPMHVPSTVHGPTDDPRSPIVKKSLVPSYANPISFGRPSPNIELEDEDRSQREGEGGLKVMQRVNFVLTGLNHGLELQVLIRPTD